MCRVAHDAGYVPGAVEEERGEMEGNLAMTTKEENLHCKLRSSKDVI